MLEFVFNGYQSTLTAPDDSHSSTSPAANSAPAGVQGTLVSWKLTPVSPTMTFALGRPLAFSDALILVHWAGIVSTDWITVWSDGLPPFPVSPTTPKSYQCSSTPPMNWASSPSTVLFQTSLPATLAPATDPSFA